MSIVHRLTGTHSSTTVRPTHHSLAQPGSSNMTPGHRLDEKQRQNRNTLFQDNTIIRILFLFFADIDYCYLALHIETLERAL
ncbi:unnamed protein product [Macrosiphum euphorbiae]|uniref:Uncharacterized protein n=1 Tax=Macrosiphum euphorbiae TaxID=13131 RepID=A0AAV0VUI8_9HEMI|nr:unnamed protein product [Macrosiphum euphorbiae]